MKIKLFLNYIFFILIVSASQLRSEIVLFDSKNIKVENNGNMIFATSGTATIPSDQVIIKGDKFIYDKKNSLLTVLDDVKYFDEENKIYIESEKILYNKSENTVFSKSETFIKTSDVYEINLSMTKKILY